MHTIVVLLLSAIGLILSGCDFFLESSKFNLTSEQMSKVESVDILDEATFKVTMPKFLRGQIAQLEKQLLATGKVKQVKEDDQLSDYCKSAPTVSGLASQIYGSALERDPVIEASLATMMMGSTTNQMTARVNENETKPLGWTDFESLRRKIAGASSVENSGLKLKGVPPTTGQLSLFSSLAAGKVSLFGYFGTYYNGKFVDRFGIVLEKPSIKNGIDDGTISGFFRVLIEAGVDSITPYEPVLTDGTTFPPRDQEPTFRKYVGKAADVGPTATGDLGISLKELKVIESGSNLFADQGLTLLGGFLEFLGGIDIGLIIAPNFAIGSNNTLKALARTVIETSLRRGAERALFCLAEKYNLDAIGDIIKD